MGIKPGGSLLQTGNMCFECEYEIENVIFELRCEGYGKTIKNKYKIKFNWNRAHISLLLTISQYSDNAKK